MPNKLVYSFVPVLIVLMVNIVQSSQNVDFSDISDVFQDVQFNSKMKQDDNKRIIRQSSNYPKPNQISVVFVTDVAKPMPNNWESVRNEMRLIVEEFDRRDENLVFDYVFLQTSFSR